MHYENIKRSSSLDRDKVPENGGLNVGYLLLCKGLLPRHFQAFLSPHGLDFFNDRKQQKLKKIGKNWQKLPKINTKIRFHCPSLSLQPPTGTAVVIIHNHPFRSRI
jgi:hypothetical protein